MYVVREDFATSPKTAGRGVSYELYPCEQHNTFQPPPSCSFNASPLKISVSNFSSPDRPYMNPIIIPPFY